MKVKKIHISYRPFRGDYEVELKRGETLRVVTDGQVITHGYSNNIVMVKSVSVKEEQKTWSDLSIQREIIVED